LAELSQAFAINICAYAVMSNHYHLVLHIDAARARAWSDAEVAARWESLFTLPLLVTEHLNGKLKTKADTRVALELLAELRRRLSDLSWYMRCLNETIARRANEEDHCTGRFWEGRFKSQPILDEAGLLACCVYVDLNPVRAGIAATPEESDFTAIQQRLQSSAAASPVCQSPQCRSGTRHALYLARLCRTSRLDGSHCPRR
jgi:REP element-mobilizing transposase RayT